jgi:hypothetical protein
LEESLAVKMQLSNLLQILMVLLISGGATYVQSWGCDLSPAKNAGCVKVLPQKNPRGPGEKPKHYMVERKSRFALKCFRRKN